MRIAILSYSHHGRGIGRIVRDQGHEIAGVMDSEEVPRRQLAEFFDCAGYAAAGPCLDAVQPDAALVTGKHVEMPGHVWACGKRRIPYLIDKPFADCADRLRPVAEASQKHGVFSALTLPNRQSRIVATIEELIARDEIGQIVLYGSRLNNGPPSRYDRTPSYWHNDPGISGGGCWATEASHGIDTFLQFAGPGQVTVAGAILSNALHRREVEDIAIGLLRGENGITGVVESGYSYPAGVRGGDHFFRFVGTKASVFALYGQQGEPLIELHTTEGVLTREELSHGERMQRVVAAALSALAKGADFAADIGQAVRILEVQDAVFEFARATHHGAGPNPLGAPPDKP